jgi:hypothetical protein
MGVPIMHASQFGLGISVLHMQSSKAPLDSNVKYSRAWVDMPAMYTGEPERGHHLWSVRWSSTHCADAYPGLGLGLLDVRR